MFDKMRPETQEALKDLPRSGDALVAVGDKVANFDDGWSKPEPSPLPPLTPPLPHPGPPPGPPSRLVKGGCLVLLAPVLFFSLLLLVGCDRPGSPSHMRRNKCRAAGGKLVHLRVVQDNGLVYNKTECLDLKKIIVGSND